MSKHFYIENDFTYEGFRCLVVFHYLGHRCGYVGFDQSNPFYGKQYSDKIEILKKSELINQSLGKRSPMSILALGADIESEITTPECYFNVHGGITFSGKSPLLEDSDLWFFGFDCGHYDDAKDYKTAFKYFNDLDILHSLSMIRKVEEMFPTEGTIRTQSYVEQECKDLVDQMIKLIH